MTRSSPDPAAPNGEPSRDPHWIASRELWVDPQICRQTLRRFQNTRGPDSIPPRIYAGIGLAGRALSLGLPVDVLALVAAVEHLRRIQKAETALLLIADSNATAAGFAPHRVRALAGRYRQQLQSMCGLVGAAIEIELASQSPRFRFDLPTFDQNIARLGLPPYVHLQLKQMAQLAAQGFGLKVGWCMRGANRDEMHFDRLFTQHIQKRNISSSPAPPHHFVYAHSGRTFDDRGPRACPYISYNEETRLMVGQKEAFLPHLTREFARAPRATRGYRRYLLKIARSLRPLLPENLARKPGLELLQAIAGGEG